MPIRANEKTREEWATLPAMEPLPVEVIDKPKARKSNFDDGGEQLDLLVRVFEGPFADGHLAKPSKLHVYVGLTMGNSNDGTKSKCRQLAEAVYGPLSDEQAYALDLEQLGPAQGADHGARFVLMGNYKDPNADRLSLKPIGFKKWEPNGQEAAAKAVPPAVAGDDGYQYNEGRTHRWKAPMTAWEPVPQAVAPPVPSSPPAPPTPPAPPQPPPPPDSPHAPTSGEIEF